jgi:hypothetical protein
VFALLVAFDLFGKGKPLLPDIIVAAANSGLWARFANSKHSAAFARHSSAFDTVTLAWLRCFQL